MAITSKHIQLSCLLLCMTLLPDSGGKPAVLQQLLVNCYFQSCSFYTFIFFHILYIFTISHLDICFLKYSSITSQPASLSILYFPFCPASKNPLGVHNHKWGSKPPYHSFEISPPPPNNRTNSHLESILHAQVQ